MSAKNTDIYIEKFERFIPVIMKGFHKLELGDDRIPDITFPQMMMLRNIYKMECPKMSDISSELCVTMGNVTMMIDRLVHEGFVERISDPDDRRIVKVCLTASGKGVIRKAEDKKRKNLKELFEKMGDDDVKAFLNIMEKLSNTLMKE